MNLTVRKTTLITAAALITAMAVTACSGGSADVNVPNDQAPDNTDINLDALNESVESIKNLDLGPEGSNSAQETEPEEKETAQEPSGDKTVYSYTDVTRDGNDITVVPNGGLNGSTVLYGGKDLNGLLDYVDSTVLEEGRTINRDLFYEILATMLVDKDMSSDVESIEKNMIMALAVANNFHDTDVSIRECGLDANNAADYHFQVTAFGKDDTWIVNFGKRTFYMNNGATEYSSDMFKDDYLALWLIAVDEYYGIK